MSMLSNTIITFYYKLFFSASSTGSLLPCTGRSEILNGERVRLETKLKRLVLCSLLHSQEPLGWGEAGEDVYDPRSRISFLSSPSFSGPHQLHAHCKPSFLLCAQCYRWGRCSICPSLGGHLISKSAQGIRHSLCSFLCGPQRQAHKPFCVKDLVANHW